MSRRGVVSPLHLNRSQAVFAAAVLEERMQGAHLKGTPLAALPTFSLKLRAALRRRRKTTEEIVMWTVTRDEAEAGYQYFMAFSHEAVSQSTTGLNNDDMDTVHDVALSILGVLINRRGRQALGADEIQRWLDAWNNPDTSDADVPDPRWVRRLKWRQAQGKAVWEALAPPQPPLEDWFLHLLVPRKNTKN